MIKLSRQQLADLRRCTPATVSRAKLPKCDDGKYDLEDSEVWNWVTAPTVTDAIREKERKKRKGANVDDLNLTALEEEQLRENIEWKRKQSRKLDLDYDIRHKNLIPVELISIWIGLFASGIRTNFLNIGSRVARGDTSLRNRIETEIKKAIEKTISGAETGLKKEGKRILKAIGEES